MFIPILLNDKIAIKYCYAIYYRYDQYGSDDMGGYYYYKESRPFISANQKCYVDCSCYESWCALG